MKDVYEENTFFIINNEYPATVNIDIGEEVTIVAVAPGPSDADNLLSVIGRGKNGVKIGQLCHITQLGVQQYED